MQGAVGTFTYALVQNYLVILRFRVAKVLVEPAAVRCAHLPTHISLVVSSWGKASRHVGRKLRSFANMNEESSFFTTWPDMKLTIFTLRIYIIYIYIYIWPKTLYQTHGLQYILTIDYNGRTRRCLFDRRSVLIHVHEVWPAMQTKMLQK